MKNRIIIANGVVVTVLLMQVALPTTPAQTGVTYTLGGTIGQPDAGTLSGGAYTLAGGFWGGVNSAGAVYLPLVVR